MNSPEEFEQRMRSYTSPLLKTPAQAYDNPEPAPAPEQSSGSLISNVGEFAVPMIAPGLLGMLASGGTMAASAAFPAAAPLLMNPATQAGLQAGAGFAGRKINQALGLEPEGTAGDIASAVIPGAFELGKPVVGAMARGVLRRTNVGREVLEEEAIGRTRGLAEQFVAAPTDAEVNALYAAAHASGARIPTKAVKDAAADPLLKYERLEAMGIGALADKPTQSLLQQIKTMPSQIQMDMLSEMRTRLMEDARAALRSTEAGSGERARALFKVAYAFDDAVDEGVKAGLTSPGQAKTLMMARDAYYKKNIAEELTGIIEAPGKIRTAKDGSLEVVNIGGILDEVLKGKSEQSKLVRGYLDKTHQTEAFRKEMQAIGELIKKPLRIIPPTLPTGAAVGGAAGAYLGPSVGVSPAVGLPLGGLAGGITSAGIQNIMGRLLTTSAGRRLVANTLSATDGVITPSAYSLFIGATRGLPGQMAGTAGRELGESLMAP